MKRFTTLTSPSKRCNKGYFITRKEDPTGSFFRGSEGTFVIKKNDRKKAAEKDKKNMKKRLANRVKKEYYNTRALKKRHGAEDFRRGELS